MSTKKARQFSKISPGGQGHEVHAHHISKQHKSEQQQSPTHQPPQAQRSMDQIKSKKDVSHSQKTEPVDAFGTEDSL